MGTLKPQGVVPGVRRDPGSVTGSWWVPPWARKASEVLGALGRQESQGHVSLQGFQATKGVYTLKAWPVASGRTAQTHFVECGHFQSCPVSFH